VILDVLLLLDKAVLIAKVELVFLIDRDGFEVLIVSVLHSIAIMLVMFEFFDLEVVTGHYCW